MHIKRSKMPKTWPVPRKSNKRRYVAVPTHAKSKGISVLYLLRDIMKIVKTRKETKIMVLNKEIKVNHKIIKDENYPLQVFGILSLGKTNKHYRLEIVNQKFKLNEIAEKDTNKKTVKIIGKVILSKKVIQMNLDDGQNFISKEKFAIGDSAVVNLKERKVEKTLPLKEGSKVEVILGKHAGKTGKIIGFKELGRGKDYLIKMEDKEVLLPLKTILVVE
jgi:ribosomal protein S4E